MNLMTCSMIFGHRSTWSVLAAAMMAAAIVTTGAGAGFAGERTAFTRDQLRRAVVLDDPGLRFRGDSPEAFRAAIADLPGNGAWLSLSGGAENGAFGAGLLAGWSDAGDRPAFTVITGVSTGALMAPYVFLGSMHDDQLKTLYTTTASFDVFEMGDGGRGESLLDTWPLRELIARHVTPSFLEAIAAEHRKGRRLFVVTTSIDAQRPMVWNMGAIAARGDEGIQLFRDVLLASASIPGVFPPVYIEAEVDGRPLREMHVDGATNAPFYVAPEPLLRAGSRGLPAASLTVILNQKLGPEFHPTPSNTLAILGQSISIGVKAATRGNMALVGDYCRRTALACDFAVIRDTFAVKSQRIFDSAYMEALYAFGRLQGSNKAFRWNETIPAGATVATGAVPRPAATARACARRAPPDRPQTVEPHVGDSETEPGLACALAVPAQ